MRKESGVITHSCSSCGVPEPWLLRRYHCRVVQEDGRSIPLDQLYPDMQPERAAARSLLLAVAAADQEARRDPIGLDVELAARAVC